MNVQDKFNKENLKDYIRMAKLLNQFSIRMITTTGFAILLCILWRIIEPLRIHYVSPVINDLFGLTFVAILFIIILYLFSYGAKTEKKMATIIRAFENKDHFYTSFSLSNPTYCGRAKRILRLAGFKFKFFYIIDISQFTQIEVIGSNATDSDERCE